MTGLQRAKSTFEFCGAIPASKSILNRLLILKSYSRGLVIVGDSGADDVLKMRGAIAALENGRPADCGAAGTTFRFLALRASRLPGRHLLLGSPRLLARPQSELLELLAQLGCRAELRRDGLSIESSGWILKDRTLKIDRSVSSQFASAVLLNAWGLPEPLEIVFAGDAVSEGYLQMTVALVRRAGLDVAETKAGFTISAGGAITVAKLEAEADLSSAFAVAALAIASGGSCQIENWPEKSLQPDALFVDIVNRMGVMTTLKNSRLGLAHDGRGLAGIDAKLDSAPDLFPVLAVLCAMASGRSKLHGAPHLAHKESDRIAKTAELLELLGVRTQKMPDGMVIEGAGSLSGKRASQPFDPADDHRLAMAAAVARAGGAELQLLRPETVNKSFPEFWPIFYGSGKP